MDDDCIVANKEDNVILVKMLKIFLSLYLMP